ncbi:MAG: T9SS type A sorting domain-containing protein, partial [Saprospiraceae bacterium]|nr:T9SS type A sorting domain-containing protein [Saprospiraceae bacterium]
NLADNMTLYPNPFAGSFTFGYLAGQQEKLNVRWADMNGRTVLEQTLQAEKGYNEWQPQAPASAGVYMLTVETEKGKVTKKVVRTAP